MKNYYDFLSLKKIDVNYINSYEDKSDIRKFIDGLDSNEINKIKCIDPEDNWLEKRLKKACEKKGIEIQLFENPLFINSKKELESFFRKDKKNYFKLHFIRQKEIDLGYC